MRSLEYISGLSDADSLNREIKSVVMTECKNIYDDNPPAEQAIKAAWLRQRVVTELVKKKNAVEQLPKIEMKHEQEMIRNIKNKKKVMPVLKNKRDIDFIYMQVDKKLVSAWIEDLSEESIRFLKRVEKLETYSSSFIILECFMGICTKNVMCITNHLEYQKNSRMNSLMHIEQNIV